MPPWLRPQTALRASGYRAPIQPGHSSLPVPFDLAAGRSFEVAALHRVAIWYGGFTEAATRVDSIVRWLDGGSDEGPATLEKLLNGHNKCLAFFT